MGSLPQHSVGAGVVGEVGSTAVGLEGVDGEGGCVLDGNDGEGERVVGEEESVGGFSGNVGVLVGSDREEGAVGAKVSGLTVDLGGVG